MIDLHSHTTASDGQYPADTLLALARQAGVRTLAVTDHDTVGGLPAAIAAARAEGLRLVPGIEFSAFVHGKEAHVLGHFVSPDDPKLKTFGETLRFERERRMEQMVEKMRALGFPVRMEDVLRVAGPEAQLGRPHLARALVERGWTTSTKEAFDRWLGDGRPAWVDRYRLSGEEAVTLIKGAGGTATLAHPGTSRMERYDIQALRAAGLEGLEALHTDHNPSVRAKYLKIAAELDLVPTAGSDFHGEKVAPARKLGDAAMPEENFERLRARAPAASLFE